MILLDPMIDFKNKNDNAPHITGVADSSSHNTHRDPELGSSHSWFPCAVLTVLKVVTVLEEEAPCFHFAPTNEATNPVGNIG